MNNSPMKLFVGCLVALLLVGGIIAMIFVGQYNGIVTMNKQVDQQWAEVENQLKRRFDLIPNLNKVADKFTRQEKEIYDKIIQGRQAYSNAKTTGDKINAVNEFSSDLSRLLVVVEQNPELKSDRILTNFMVSLEGTENRIAVARKRYNDIVTVYNTKISVIPGRFFASMFGFKERTLFKVPEKEQQNIEVEFSDDPEKPE